MKWRSSDNHYILAPHVKSSVEIVYLGLREEYPFKIVDFGSLAFPWITQTFIIRETGMWNTNSRIN